METWKGIGMMLGSLILTVGGSHWMTSNKIDDSAAMMQQQIGEARRAEFRERHRQDSLRDMLIIAKIDTLLSRKH